MNEFILEEIIRNVAYESYNGVINLNQPHQISMLKEELLQNKIELGISEEVIDEVINHLFEVTKIDKADAPFVKPWSQHKQTLKFKGVGGRQDGAGTIEGYEEYIKTHPDNEHNNQRKAAIAAYKNAKSSYETKHNSVLKKYGLSDPKEPEASPKKKVDEPKDVKSKVNKEPEKKQVTKASDIKSEPEKVKESDKDNKALNSQIEKSTAQLDKSTSKYTKNSINTAKEALQDLKKLFAMSDPNKQKEELAKLNNKYGFGTNTSDQRLYLGVLGKESRILGHTNKLFVDKIRKIDSGIFKEEGQSALNFKAEITAKSKPSLITVAKNANDKNLQAIFSDKIFDAIEPSKRSVYAPLDKDGNMIPFDSKKYFEHSVNNNKSVEDVMNVLKKSEDKSYTQQQKSVLVKALEEHQKNLQKVQSKVPSANAEKEVLDSYNNLTKAFYSVDKTLASTVMKNFAEMVIYDSELAAGKKVFLPAAGTFPTADKLLIDKAKGSNVEHIGLISVKYGKSGKYVYGFPGECSKYQLWHPDKEKRDACGNFIGQKDHTLAIHDKFLKSEKDFVKMFNDSVLHITKSDNAVDKAIAKKLLPEIQKDLPKLLADVNKFKSKVEDTIKKTVEAEKKKTPKPPASYPTSADIINIVKPLYEEYHNPKNNSEYVKFMTKHEAKLRLIYGANNIDNATIIMGGDQTGRGVGNILNMIGMSNVLTTSDGLKAVHHNHLNYEDTKLEIGDEIGKADIRYYNIVHRNLDTGRSNSTASYNEARFTPSTEKSPEIDKILSDAQKEVDTKNKKNADSEAKNATALLAKKLSDKDKVREYSAYIKENPYGSKTDELKKLISKLDKA